MAGIFYLVRHGSTEDNSFDKSKAKLNGGLPLPLSNKGRKEAQGAGDFLARLGVTRLFSSPLARALETAEIVSKRIRVPVTISKQLRGWNYGSMNGMLVEPMIPFLEFFQTHPGIAPPDGEPFMAVFERFRNAFRTLCMDALMNPTGRVAVITHSRCIGIARNLAQGNNDPADLKIFDQHVLPPGSITEVRVDGPAIKLRLIYP